MKSLYTLAALLVMGLSISAFAAETVPVDSKGNATHPEYAGVSTCEITASTGTTALLCATGEGIILDVFASSVATTDMLVFRDSATANTSSTVLFSLTQAHTTSQLRKFPRFKKGLSVNATVAPTAIGTARPNWVIVYTQKLK